MGMSLLGVTFCNRSCGLSKVDKGKSVTGESTSKLQN